MLHPDPQSRHEWAETSNKALLNNNVMNNINIIVYYLIIK